MEKKIAIIPARSGSKGLIDKNIRMMNGKPLMSYSIIAALESGVFDEVMVSTDSEQYAEIARKWGASVPFLRSEATSSDTASSWDMVREVLDHYEAEGKTFDAFCLLQPTSPLRTAQDIQDAEKLFKQAAVSVVSVCRTDHSPLSCNTLPPDCGLGSFVRPEMDVPRQKMEPYYRINGAIYFVRIEAFNKNSFLYRDGSYAMIMSKERSVDIDTELDFKIAEFLMKEFEKTERDV